MRVITRSQALPMHLILLRTSTRSRTLRNGEKNKIVHNAFAAYKSMVENYTIRELSYLGDILNAFAGVFAVLGERLQSRTLFGLPANFIDLAFLWTPAGHLERRVDVVPGSVSTAASGQNAESVCPTWSWVAFIVPVEYRFFHGRRASTKTSTAACSFD